MKKIKVSLKEILEECEKIWRDSNDMRFIRVVSNGFVDSDKITKELDKMRILYLIDSAEESIRPSYTIDLNQIEIIY